MGKAQVTMSPEMQRALQKWLPIVIPAVAVAVLVFTVGFLLGGRKHSARSRPPVPSTTANAPADQAPAVTIPAPLKVDAPVTVTTTTPANTAATSTVATLPAPAAPSQAGVVATSTPIAGGTGAAPTTTTPVTLAPSAPMTRRDLLRACPFDLRVGQEVRRKPGTNGPSVLVSNLVVKEKLARVTAIECGEWRLQGINRQPLQLLIQPVEGATVPITLWQDQPYELVKDGQLIARFQTATEYTEAQQ